MAQPSKSNNQRNIQVVGTLISLGLLGFVLLRQDWQELLRLTAGIPIAVFVLGIALIVIRVIAHAMRWLILLRAQQIDLGITATLRLQWACLYAGNFLPTSVGGDVVRLYGVLPASPSRVVAVASIAVDRALGVIGMLFVLPFSIPLVSSIFGGAIAGLFLSRQVLMDRVQSVIDRLKQALSLWASKPLSLLLALLASFVGIICFLLAMYALALALNIPVNFAQVAGATALTYYIALIPFSINAYGIR